MQTAENKRPMRIGHTVKPTPQPPGQGKNHRHPAPGPMQVQHPPEAVCEGPTGFGKI